MFKVLFYLSLLSISVLARSKLFLQLSQTDMKYWTEVSSKPQDLHSSNSTGEKYKTTPKPNQNKPTTTKSPKQDIQLKRDFVFHKGLFLSGMKKSESRFLIQNLNQTCKKHLVQQSELSD